MGFFTEVAQLSCENSSCSRVSSTYTSHPKRRIYTTWDHWRPKLPGSQGPLQWFRLRCHWKYYPFQDERKQPVPQKTVRSHKLQELFQKSKGFQPQHFNSFGWSYFATTTTIEISKIASSRWRSQVAGATGHLYLWCQDQSACGLGVLHFTAPQRSAWKEWFATCVT